MNLSLLNYGPDEFIRTLKTLRNRIENNPKYQRLGLGLILDPEDLKRTVCIAELIVGKDRVKVVGTKPDIKLYRVRVQILSEYDKTGKNVQYLVLYCEDYLSSFVFIEKCFHLTSDKLFLYLAVEYAKKISRDQEAEAIWRKAWTEAKILGTLDSEIHDLWFRLGHMAVQDYLRVWASRNNWGMDGLVNFIFTELKEKLKDL